MKSNYETPKLILKVFDQDVITTSTPEDFEALADFDAAWLEE